MAERQIENPGIVYRRNIPRSSYMKFHPIWSSSWGEMASNGRIDGRIDGRTDGRTNEAATICSPFGEHKKGYLLNYISLGEWNTKCTLCRHVG